MANLIEKSNITSLQLPANIIDLLNYRIVQEELSSRIYKAMSLWLEDKAYFNSAKLWSKFSNEELIHAEWSREHLLSFNIRPKTESLESISNDFSGLNDIIKKTLEHETKITRQCNEFAKACLESGDMNTFTLALKYNAEQVEEMKKANDLVTLLNSYGEDKLSLALLDHEIERFLN